VLKLARGHAAYEYGEPQLYDPESVWFSPLHTLSSREIEAFETPPIEDLFPEIGSRAFVRGIETEWSGMMGGWRVIQEGRYRYLVSHSAGIAVRMVLSEYLACEVIW
jgi:hypothetical protein